MGKDRIAVRVTAREKDKIQSKARKCGLSTSEYVKQRALGYEPRTVPPDALFACLEKLDELADKASSPELDEGIYTVLKQITAAFLLPVKGICWCGHRKTDISALPDFLSANSRN